MLGEQIRRVLLWVTIAAVIAVIAGGMASVLGLLVRTEDETAALNVTPPEVTLCQQEQATFTVEPALEDIEWAATGGEISPDGHYTAGELPGDYEVRAAGPERGQRGRAFVHVVLCTPTPPASPTPTPAPSPTPSPEPAALPAADAQGDVAGYSTGAPVAAPPPGLDIRNASVTAELRIALDTAAGLPPELAEWMEEGEAVLWIALYDPIDPATLPTTTDWLFVVDMDGDPATGRPPGTRPINPDLGDEVAIGVSYYPDGTHRPYLLIWSSTAQDWVERPDVVRHWVNEERTLVALAVPLELLTQQVSEYAGVTFAPELARGRAAAISYAAPDPVVDFYPDLPE